MAGFEDAFAAIRGLTNYETMVRPPYGRRAMNLPRTRALLRRLGNPDRSFPILQVAGTKGKGTASTALAAALSAGGYRTGLFTSPHLFHLRERICVSGRWITEEAFAAGVEEILRHVEPLRGRPECPTFFELITALALLEFRRQEVDAAVLEVGLGGRLDATSAAPRVASLITSIGHDHTAILGKTTALIAAEKAGVARRGVPLVSGVPPAGAAGRTIARVAAERGAPLHRVGREFHLRTGRPRLENGRYLTPVRVHTEEGRSIELRPPVLGRVLARDAGLAAALLLHPRVRRRLPLDGLALADAMEKLALPGRMQFVAGSPNLIVDGAHNPDSARALAETVREAVPHRRVFAVVGGGLDKGVDRIARILEARLCEVRIVFTRPESHPRADDPERLAAAHRGASWAQTLAAAMKMAREAASAEDLLIVTGSLYLAGEALVLLGLDPTSCRGPCGSGCPAPAGSRATRRGRD